MLEKYGRLEGLKESTEDKTIIYIAIMRKMIIIIMIIKMFTKKNNHSDNKTITTQ